MLSLLVVIFSVRAISCFIYSFMFVCLFVLVTARLKSYVLLLLLLFFKMASSVLSSVLLKSRYSSYVVLAVLSANKI